MLHRLVELYKTVRQGYYNFDYKRVFSALHTFLTVDLSAFYFDIRKDALYCDAADSKTRRAARTVLDLLFHRLTTWLAPMLVFTMEEVWLERFPGADSSVHLVDFPETPDWRDPALAAKWSKIRAARRVVTGALEIKRRDKVIGASLEAAPVLYVADADTAKAVKSVDMAELCITSALTIAAHEPPEEAFRLEDPAIGVVFETAEGEKCQRCWKILPDVGRHAHPATCARCDDALG
jgi:isoleucyl-tRNA synthetase